MRPTDRQTTRWALPLSKRGNLSKRSWSFWGASGCKGAVTPSMIDPLYPRRSSWAFVGAPTARNNGRRACEKLQKPANRTVPAGFRRATVSLISRVILPWSRERRCPFCKDRVHSRTYCVAAVSCARGVAMKTNKALKRLTKIEALMADVTDRYSTGASHIQEALQHAKAAVVRAKDVVSLHVSAVASAAVVAAKVARGGKEAAPARKTAGPKKVAAKVPAVKTAKKSAPVKKRAKSAIAKTAPKSAANKKAAIKKTLIKKTGGSGAPAAPETAAS